MTQGSRTGTNGLEPKTAEPQSTDAEEKTLTLAPVRMQTGGGVRSYLRKVWAVAMKDIRAEVRAKEVLSTMVAFGVLAVVIFSLAFDVRVPNMKMVAPGVLWAVVLFAGVLGLHRSFGGEMDRGSLAALLMAPVDRSAVYFGKLLANLFFMLTMELMVLPVALVVFDVNLFRLWILVGLFLGTLGYVGIGTLFAALTASVRARETLLPILLLPVMVPIFLAGAGLTAGVVDGRPMEGLWRWLQMMLIYDTVFIVVAYLVFDLIWEEV